MKVPPSRSASCSAAVAGLLDELAARGCATSVSESRSTERITGTTSPCGAATAIPTFADGNRSSASSANWTLTSGWRMSAPRADLGEQVGDGDADVGVELARALDQRVRLRHVDRHGELEDGHLPGLGQPAGDRPADARERNRLDLVGHAEPERPALAPGRGAARRRRPMLARSTSSATIRPSGPVPVRPTELEPALARHPARERRGLDAPGRLVPRAVDHGAERSMSGSAAGARLGIRRGSC